MLVRCCQLLFLIWFSASVISADVLVQSKHDNETIIACTNDSECELVTKWLFWLLTARCRRPVKDGNDQEAICVEEVNMERVNITFVALLIFVLLCLCSVCGYVQMENRRFATAYAEQADEDDNDDSSAERKKQKSKKHQRRKSMTTSACSKKRGVGISPAFP